MGSSTRLSIAGLAIACAALVATGGESAFASHRTPTKISVVASHNPSKFGQAVTITARVTEGASPTGKIAFMDGPKKLATRTLSSGGVATFTISTLGVGDHVIVAKYSGDTNNIASISVALKQAVGFRAGSLPPGAQHFAMKAPPKPPADRERMFYATAYRDVFAHTNLYSLPYEAATGQLKLDNVYYNGVGLGYVIVPSFSLPMPFCECRAEGLSLEVEGQFGKYSGLQHNYESDLAFADPHPPAAAVCRFLGQLRHWDGRVLSVHSPTIRGQRRGRGAVSRRASAVLGLYTVRI